MMPYTYLIGWRNLDVWYYGVRSVNKEDPERDLWVHYFTSSKFVKAFRKDHGEPDVIRVHKTFSDTTSAVEYEKRILRKLNVVSSDRFLNRSIGGSSGFHSGKYRTPETYTKISLKLKGRTVRRGFTHSPESREKIGKAHRGKNPSQTTRDIWSKQRTGKTPWNKGIAATSEQSKKLSDSGRLVKHTCPHCRMVGGNVMFRWHFDNCKMKEKQC